MEKITAYKCNSCGTIWEEDVICECVTKDILTQDYFKLFERVNEDYDEYIKSGAKVTFDDSSVLLSDVLIIKNTIIEDIEDYNILENLKSLYQETDKNIIEEISNMFERAYLDGDIEGYYEGYINAHEISSVIEVYFYIHKGEC